MPTATSTLVSHATLLFNLMRPHGVYAMSCMAGQQR